MCQLCDLKTKKFHNQGQNRLQMCNYFFRWFSFEDVENLWTITVFRTLSRSISDRLCSYSKCLPVVNRFATSKIHVEIRSIQIVPVIRKWWSYTFLLLLFHLIVVAVCMNQNEWWALSNYSQISKVYAVGMEERENIKFRIGFSVLYHIHYSHPHPFVRIRSSCMWWFIAAFISVGATHYERQMIDNVEWK